MDTETAAAIMEFVIESAKDYNLAESDSTGTATLVVNFYSLNRYFKLCMRKEYSEMLKHYSELFDFLMNRGRDVYDKKSDTKWTYHIIHGKKYDKNDLYKKKDSLAIKKIEIIGSTHTKLDLDDSDLNLGIRIHPTRCLREMGMQATLPIPVAKRTQFTKPKSGLQCFIGVDDGLIFERDVLITEYLKLDKRTKPLIIAILRLSRSQRINKSCCLPTLSTYSYILVTLHYLMNVLENPVIPNLQNLPVECNSADCFYNLKDEPVTTFFNNKIENLDVSYHNCVRIINKQTGEYNVDNNNELKTTICTDAVWVQDPYLVKKNIAHNCQYDTIKVITNVFTTVEEMLKDGHSYQEVCDKKI
ncbi:hypothetical protein HPULCUR_001398 [Helicostylum pulchrum]|uniref:Uncharacterized protein n=1 Tax=Helicostylum pulchrum TaxID=562976 RepID=A0ABP9XMN3_9FUNG